MKGIEVCSWSIQQWPFSQVYGESFNVAAKRRRGRKVNGENLETHSFSSSICVLEIKGGFQSASCLALASSWQTNATRTRTEFPSAQL
jgi:hypothetical protein